MGTTPQWARPVSTAAKTEPMSRAAMYSAPAPKMSHAATWVNVASGPRYATRIGSSSARQAEMISRKMLRTAS